jgi:hypothetical protein
MRVTSSSSSNDFVRLVNATADAEHLASSVEKLDRAIQDFLVSRISDAVRQTRVLIDFLSSSRCFLLTCGVRLKGACAQARSRRPWRLALLFFFSNNLTSGAILV